MTLTLGELAQALGAQLEGNPDIDISRISEIQSAGPDDISFLSNPKYLKYVAETHAAALIVADDMTVDYPNLLISANPHQSMLEAIRLLNAVVRPVKPGVHATAVIEADVKVPESAEIGPGVVIETGVHLGEDIILESHVVIQKNAVIGNGCHLYPQVVVYEACELGQDCIVHAGAVIGSDGFGYSVVADEVQKIPQTGNVIIGNHVEIGANCTIDRGSLGPTRIGDGTKLDNLVHIAHNVRIGKNCFLTAQIAIAGSTVLGDRVQMGGQSGVIGHLTVGDDVSIATRGGVTRDVPSGMMVSGFPARAHRDELKIEASLQRLPDLFKRVKDLEKQNRTE